MISNKKVVECAIDALEIQDVISNIEAKNRNEGLYI